MNGKAWVDSPKRAYLQAPYDVAKVAAYRRLPASSWNRGDQMWSFRPTPAAWHTVVNMAELDCCDGRRDLAAQWEMSH